MPVLHRAKRLIWQVCRLRIFLSRTRNCKMHSKSSWMQPDTVSSMQPCEAAYRDGEEWYQAMKKYVADNIAFTKEFVEKNLPGVNMVEHEGTYLIWLDFNGLGLCTQELEDLIVHKAKLWLDSGRIFGKCGRGFQRINVACPRSTLKEALERIEKVLPADTVKFAS